MRGGNSVPNVVARRNSILTKLARYDECDETRTDFSRWKGIYETWLRHKQVYTEQLKQRELVETLRFQPMY